ncbi:hypothetical protein [Dyadobacter sp. 22481]|uniref:hypothetical protein n=1 Tax=Dyadobacter sp. 22481 TaxID=3453926 RepID=UPI003F8639F8
MKQGKTRILKSETILSELVTFGESFRIGVSFEQATKSPHLNKFGISGDFINGRVQIPIAAGPKTRTNTKGMYVRKQPEEKEDVLRHIKYRIKKTGRNVEFDRTYHIYKKELVHSLRLGFHFMTDDAGAEFIVSDLLTFDDDFKNSKKNTHVINLFLEVFGAYEVLRPNLEYFIRAEEAFDHDILPSGTLSDPRNFDRFVEYAEKHLSEPDRKPLIDRAKVLREFNPVVRRSTGGLNGYFAFHFPDKKIVAAESMKRNQATYFFEEDNYEDNLMKDKQEVLRDRLMIKRLYHTQDDTWEKKVRRFLNEH